MLINLGDRRPQIAEGAWLAPDVVLTGDVEVETEANLWFGVIARGDIEPIRIGRAANVQDGVILHTDPGMPLQIADHVAVGHGAIVHGATVEADVLIGMRATVLSGARIGTGSVVAAGSVVLERQEIPACVLVVGTPARVVREIEPGTGHAVCARYLARARVYRSAIEARKK
jgi:carbonic anhydrase/acetyltransferase-like protein (isoleucine patch superfamily)